MENIYVGDQQYKRIIPQILKVVSPSGTKLISFSLLGFVIQKNYYSETSEFKLHSFRAFKGYPTDKNPTNGINFSI